MSRLEATNEGIKFETLRIEDDILRLPLELCRNKLIFDEFFSLDTWNNLSAAVKEHLVGNFLPEALPSQQIQRATIGELFSGGLQRFKVSPMQKLQRDLENGAYRPDQLRLRRKADKKRRRMQRFRETDRIHKLARNVQRSRQNCLNPDQQTAETGSLGDLEHVSASEKAVNAIFNRSRKRFYNELSSLFREVGDCSELSSDDEYELSRLAAMKKRQKRCSQVPSSQSYQYNLKLTSTHTTKKKKESEGVKLSWNRETFEEMIQQSSEDPTLDGETSVDNDVSSVTLNGIFERVLSAAVKQNRKVELPYAKKAEMAKRGKWFSARRSEKTLLVYLFSGLNFEFQQKH